jgi:peroxiredoxin Q/BCP
MLRPGDPAPDFHAETHSGDMLSLAALRGKQVLLWFFPKAGAPGCAAEGRAFRDLAAEFEKRNTTLLGVSFDEPVVSAAFASQHGLPFDLLCDTDHEVGFAYGACKHPEAAYAERYSFLVDEDGRIAQVWTKVDPQAHAREVLDFLDSMG